MWIHKNHARLQSGVQQTGDMPAAEQTQPGQDVQGAAPETQVPVGFTPRAPNQTQQIAGDPGWNALHDDAKGTFDENSGQADPYLARAANASNEQEAIGYQAIAANREQPSRTRNILGMIAGIGMGAATMNPQVGQNMYHNIADAPKNAQLQELQQRSAIAGNVFNQSDKLSGLNQVGVENRVKAQNSRNEQVKNQAEIAKGQETANKNQYEVDHPEMESPVSTGEGEVQGFKRFNAVPGKTGVNIGSNKPEKPQPSEFKTNEAGQLVKIDGDTAVTVKGPDGQPVAMPKENITGLTTYLANWRKSNPKATPDQENAAIIKYNASVTPNFSLEAGAAARDAASKKEANVSAIAAHATKRISQAFPNAMTDPDAYKKAVRDELATYASDPALTPFLKDVSDLLLSSTPTRPPAVKGNLSLAERAAQRAKDAGAAAPAAK